MSSLSNNAQFQTSPVNLDGSPVVQMRGGEDMTSTINRSRQTVDDTRMSIEEIEALRKDGAASVAAKAADEAESEADFKRRKGYADQLGRLNRTGSLQARRAAALSAAYAALEAGVPEAFVRQGLRSLDLRESKEDREKRRQAEDTARDQRLQNKRDIAEANRKRGEEAREASKARIAERRAKKQKKGIPPKEKTDPLNLGVDVDADPKTTRPITQEEGYDAKGNPIQPAPDRDIGTPTVRDRLEAAGVSGSKNVGDFLGLKYDRDTSQYDQPRPQADMTPIDVEAENRMMFEDMLNFGPVPQSLTPSQMLDMNLKDRVGSKAPGAVGSAPNMINSLGFTAPSGNGFGDPAAAAAAQPPKRPGLIDRARGGVQDLQGRLRSGQAAQREMMAPITDQIGTFDIDETLDNLQTEFDDLSKKKKVMDLQGKVQGLQKDLSKGQRGSGVPVDHGFRQSFDQNVRQPLRDLLGMDY